MPQIGRDGYKFERLTPRQLARRWPFLDVAGVAYGVFMPQGGVLFAERIVRALALKLGNRLRAQTPVIALDPERNAARLDDGTLVAGDALIVAAGPWIGRLLPQLSARSRSYRQVAVYLEAPQKFRAAWNEAPAIVDFGGAADIYAFPSVDRTRIKIASGEYRRPGEPTSIARSIRANRQSFSNAIAAGCSIWTVTRRSVRKLLLHDDRGSPVHRRTDRRQRGRNQPLLGARVQIRGSSRTEVGGGGDWCARL